METPPNWFEDIYAASTAEGDGVPWARMAPSAEMMTWLDHAQLRGDGLSALVVGCGLGDDAEELARRGFAVTAFDVSATAIALCGERFPASRVAYQVAELFSAPPAWQGAFDLICEHRTVQSLPPDWQDRGMAAIAAFARPGGGRILAIADMRPEGAEKTGPPWRLRPEELSGFRTAGLHEESFMHEPLRTRGGRSRVTAVYTRPDPRLQTQ